jgi:beta-galactosidase
MKQQIGILLLFFHFSATTYSQKFFPENIYDFIENPQITQVNQELGRNPFVPFSTVLDAQESEIKQSNLFLSLNGNWKFSWSENIEKSIKNFYNSTFNDKKWAVIKVPGNWEMQGYGDPMFRNIQQPFECNPPFVPKDYNPVGLYRKEFNLPANWKNKEVFLRIEAASSVSFVWVNGQEIGYNAGAFEPSEYKLTKYLKPGKNNISIQVLKYSAGTYLEDQDMWRLSGIFRDVYLVATPTVHIQDFSVITDLDEEYRDAQLLISTSLKNQGSSKSENYQIEASLIDNQQKTIIKSINATKVNVSANGIESVVLESKVVNPAKWTAETPNLYTLMLQLKDASGNIIEVVTKKIGFKEIELKHQALLVNGAPIKLNGVNTHMQHPVLGHTMDIETMRKDLILMKQFNINCVRSSHYPPNNEYLDLADELGMYIVDETGDEAHATEYLSESDKWTAAYVNRAERLVLRDRSHPCVIFWSAGNESGFGNNICEVIKRGKELDPTRLWMYGGNTDDPAWANEVPCEDIIGPRYPTPAELKYRIANVPESQDPRPSFMDEYVAATGNGAGGLDEYWDIIWNSKRCIGGAIWDWVSPGLTEKVKLLKDASPNHIITSINGRAKVVTSKQGAAIQFNGFDQWVDVYRHPELDITGDKLTLSIAVKPTAWNGNGTFLTKGSNQYGLIQKDKDSIQFYVGTAKISPNLASAIMPGQTIFNLESSKEGKVTVKIPENWYGNWHQLVGIYNGSSLELYVDGQLAGNKKHSGNILNRPFPINIGRDLENSEKTNTTRNSNALFDQVMIFNKALSIDQLLYPNQQLKEIAALWLDFDTVEEKGDYYSLGHTDARSYGLIWPDRTPQPELWQVKKSAQPVLTKLLDAEKGLVEITNRNRFLNLNEYTTVWQLIADDKILQSGNLDLSVAPMKTLQTSIPYTVPIIASGVEYRLLVSFKLKQDKPWAKKDFEVAFDEFTLPYKSKYSPSMSSNTTVVALLDSKNVLNVNGTNFNYQFDKASGKLISLQYMGKEMIQSGPKLNIWRAPLANEFDGWGKTGADLNYKPAMGNDVANAWRSFGLDHLNYQLDNFLFTQINDNEVLITVNCHSEGINYKTIFEEKYSYRINGNGEIAINHAIIPQGFMPAWIPCIGNQWKITNDLSQVVWYGKGPFENYPDRKTGAKTGIYKSSVNEMRENYLLPQDYGLRTENRWLKLENKDGFGLEFKSDKWFDFAAQAFDTDNLSRAKYMFQLQPATNITLNLNYQTSGVGCTSTSVLNQYRVVPQYFSYNFNIRPYKLNLQEK